MKIGSHVSIAGGLLGAAMEAVSYGCNTFMIYTGAPQNTKRIPISDMKIEEGKLFMLEHGIDISDIVIHAPYIINLASYKRNIFEMGHTLLKTEIERTNEIGAKLIVLHPGAFTDKDLNYGINKIAEGLNLAIDSHIDVTVCLETMAGKGTEVGRTFNELALIIEKVEVKDKIGVCFDTCHVHDSGYDIITDFDNVIEQFDNILGLDLLKVYHINGSLNPRGAKKDRHANIGATHDNPKGKDFIGFDAIANIVTSKKSKDKIFILETPWIDKTKNLYKEEIAALRKFKKNN